MTVEQQEAAVGREKLSDIELPDAQKSAGAHTALTSIEDDDGTELEILRDNMPFGSVAAADGRRVRHLLRRLHPRPRRDRADAAQHVRRRPAGRDRPAARGLHRRHRIAVLRADRRPARGLIWVDRARMDP